MAGADRGPKIISVVVAEDHPSIRENLRHILNAERDMTCVGVAKSGREALEVTVQKLPDVLILDAEFPDLDGIEVALRLRRLAPAVRTILYSAEPTIPELARRARLAGFVVKGAPLQELLTAVRRAAFAARTQPRRK
jgi:DNA-binding NarL/FixJ family response regulator